MSNVPLVSFQNVTKRRADGHRQVTVLSCASFDLPPGAAVGIWGARHSGKTTLLRLAAGMDLADEGRVLFGGHSLSAMGQTQRELLLGADVGFVSPADWRPGHGELALDYVALPLLSAGATLQRAARAARVALRRVDATEIAEKLLGALTLGERIRVMLARALINRPRLLLVDEPAATPSVGDREEISDLLVSLARERELTLLIASEEMISLRCADFLMSIGAGRLVRSNEQTASVSSARNVANLPVRNKLR